MMIDFLRRSRPGAAAVILSFALVACDGDDDAGGDDFNEETAAEMAGVADEISNATASSEQVQANLTNALFSGPMGGAALSPLMPFEVMARMRAASFGDVASVRTAASIAAPSAPDSILLPEEIEGITFVWDVTDSMYVASDRVGAPSNGVRFIFYAVHPLSGYPTVPLNEIGYMDLVDESTSDVARLEVFVRDEDNDRTVADYFLQGEVDSVGASNTVTLESEGFFANAGDRLDFDMQMVFGGNDSTDEAELHTRTELSTDAGTITLDHDEVSTEAGFDATAEFIIEGDGNEAAFGFEVTGDDEVSATVDGALTWNGEEVVLIEGDADNPEFTDPDGGNLTADQIEALAAMWFAFGAVYAHTFLHLFPFLLLMAFSGF